MPKGVYVRTKICRKNNSNARKKYYANGGVHPMKGKHFSIEVKNKMMEAKKKFFENGGIPWNKGTKGTCKSNSGSFVKGHKISEESKRKKSESIRKYYVNGGVSPMKGQKLSQEHKNKISKALKGKIVSIETRKKLSKASIGRRHSNETRKRLSKARKKYFMNGGIGCNKGKHFSVETKEKLSKSHIGIMAKEKHHNWKGGITPLIRQIRNSIEYKKWRKKVFQNNYYTCQKTKIKSRKNIVVHHIKNFSKILKENNIRTMKDATNCLEFWDVNNGIVLLKEIHETFHRIYGRNDNTKEQLKYFLNS